MLEEGEGSTETATRLIECLRDCILNDCNSNGEFADIGITPRVFMVDFEDRIRTLLQLQQETEDTVVVVGYALRCNVNFWDVHLRLHVKGRSTEYVDLLSFSRSVAQHKFFQTLLPRVENVLKDFFPTCIQPAPELLATKKSSLVPMTRKKRVAECGGELAAALARHARGAENLQRTHRAKRKQELPLLVQQKKQKWATNRQQVVLRAVCLVAVTVIYFRFIKPSL